MTVTTRALPVYALFAAAALGACGGGQAAPAPAPAPAPAAVDTAAQNRMRRDSIAQENQRTAAAAEDARRRATQDSLDRVRAMEEAARRDSEMLRGTVMSGINFDFDRSDLRDDAKATLDAKIPILMANANVTIRIAGHADERGSSEYNLALGQRRAAAAKKYLVDRGVAEGRIETTSFGEERPVCTESSENCWAQNRRDEFEITGGGPNLTRPRS